MKQGKCCPVKALANPETPDHICCSICYEVMTQPVKVNCKAEHVFGKACIEEWAITRENLNCPLCRNEVNSLEVHTFLKEEIDKLSTKCQFCGQSSIVQKYSKHNEVCEKKYPFYEKSLKNLVVELKQFLSLNILPHYNKCHSAEFQKFIDGQENDKDLLTNGRNWNWWWSINSEWNDGCIQCTKFWNQFGQQIHYLDSKRIKLIEQINEEFVIDHMRSLFE